MEEVKKKRGRKPLIKKNEEVEVKVLKKRGRKPKIKDNLEESVPKELKKRGRKPKPKHPEELLPKVPKKRGRKPKDKYGFYQKNEVNKLTNHLNDNIILHLPIHSSEIDNNDFNEQSLLKYNPNINTPVPYEPSLDDKFMDLSPYPFDKEQEETNTEETNSQDSSDKTESCNVASQEVPPSEIEKSFGTLEDEYIINHENSVLGKNMNSLKVSFQEVSVELNSKNRIMADNMNEFRKSNENQCVPLETNVNCWWCCHEFSNSPYVLPLKKVNDCINVMGCFCCAECAASWNFNSDKRNNDIWESYSLLNLLYRKYLNGNSLRIKFAPPRESLIKFGGSLTIEEFRSHNNSYNKDIKNICYPVISLIPQMEEVFMNFSDKNKNYIPVDMNRIKKVNNDLKLKRCRPVTDPINTLESCMNLKYI